MTLKTTVLTGLAALAFAPGAYGVDADVDIEDVVVSRSSDDRLTFRLELAEPVTIDDTSAYVAIDADRNVDTGIEYSLNWTGSPYVISTPEGEKGDTAVKSLRFELSGATVTFSIASSDIGSPARFDFWTSLEHGQDEDTAPEGFSGPGATYPRHAVGKDGVYPTETYDDLDDSVSNGDLGPVVVTIGGLLALGGVVALAGWSFERWRKRRNPPPAGA